MTEHFAVAVVGSGFAGTMLARILHRLGIETVLIERDAHPRFAIGESSTPLAAICLERLARRYDFEDLSWLAAYGRWREHIPEVRRGLKRGFTFFGHRAGEVFTDTPENRQRLLVAASSDDEVSDSHWLREDVDHFLVRRATAEGVDFRDRLRVQRVEWESARGWYLTGTQRGQLVNLSADLLVDATGAGGLLARQLPIAADMDDVALDTALVFSHFESTGSFAELPAGPYPDECAAVHHLLEEGWLYVLPFDHRVVSAGLILHGTALERLRNSGVETPEAIWETVIARYPSLEAQFSGARVRRPLSLVPRVQRRLAEPAGQGWALLPHSFAFFDPMFSTGIAWSLLGVERLAGVFETALVSGHLHPPSVQRDLDRYGSQLQIEARQMMRLLEGAFAAMSDFDLFVAQSFLYFAVVSFAEVDQRLHPEGRDGVEPAWHGFLGAGSPQIEGTFRQARQRLQEIPRDERGAASDRDREEFASWVEEAIADRNVAGLGDPRRRNLYPVDLDLLIERAQLLGLTPDAVRASLPLLRGSISARADENA